MNQIATFFAGLAERSAWILFVVASFSLGVLLAPHTAIEALRLAPFLARWGDLLGPVGLFAGALWVAHPSTVRAWLGSVISKRIEARRQLAEQEALMHKIVAELLELSPDEWVTLAFFVYRRGRSQPLWMYYPPARSLLAKGFLKPDARRAMATAYPHSIPSYVWALVKDHPIIEELLGRDDVIELLDDFDRVQRAASTKF